MLRSPRRVEVRRHARVGELRDLRYLTVIVSDVGKPHARSAGTAKIEDVPLIDTPSSMMI